MFQANQNLMEFVLVEYPGVVKNLDKAMETLGGIRTVSNAHFGNTPMEVQFRPENPFHSSLVAERKNQGVVFSGELNLVIRCRRRKQPPNRDEGPSTSKSASKLLKLEKDDNCRDSQMEITCLGMVSTVYSFKNICDFQYLPLGNTPTQQPGRVHVHHDLLPRMVPCEFGASLEWWNEHQPEFQRMIGGPDAANTLQEAESFLPPYLFSRYNNPSKFLLHDDVDRSVRRLVAVGHGKSLRTERKAHTISVSARDPFPVAPSDEALRDVELRCKSADHHRLLIELFNERPLWSRVAIAYRTRIQDTVLKIILAKYAFYITSGPWGRLWCRFGYDPRLDPDARKFQSLMVSFKRNQYIPERQRLRANTTALRAHNSVQHGIFCDYVYRPRVLPALRQMWYCVCDVQLPLAQRVCHRGYLEVQKQCDPEHGWLIPGIIFAIRRAIKEDVAQTSHRLNNSNAAGGAEFYELGDEDVEEDEDDYGDDFIEGLDEFGVEIGGEEEEELMNL